MISSILSMLRGGTQPSAPEVPPEIQVETNWSGFVGHACEPQPRLETPMEGKEIYFVHHVFTDDECAALLSKSEEYGYGYTNYPKRYRGNLRLITVDPEFTDAVWKRLQPFIPVNVTEKGVECKVVGLNDHWRLAKYFPGDRFASHVDGIYKDDKNNQKSMFTVNIYMNSGFSGGNTAFLFNTADDDEKSQENVVYEVIPQTGLCLLFRQPPEQYYLHEGLELTSGVKYLFRTDVMYTPV